MSKAILPGSLDDKLAYLLAHASLGRRLLPTAWIKDNRCSCLSDQERYGTDQVCTRGKPGKHPRIQDWSNRASCDEDQIIEWFSWVPYANWAWVQDETFTVDVDPSRGGLEALTQWEEATGGPDATLTARTQSGGWHFIYRQPETKLPSVKDFLPGIEVRGAGSYIMIQPSVGLEGAWTFVDHDVAVREPSDELLDLISQGLMLDVTFDERTGKRKATGKKSDLPTTDWFLRHGFGGYTGSRNQDAYKVSWRLLAYGQQRPHMYTSSRIAGIMRQIWEVTEQGDDPFSWDECLGCLKSAHQRRERQRRENGGESSLTEKMKAILTSAGAK